jgi:hypothetical protein
MTLARSPASPRVSGIGKRPAEIRLAFGQFSMGVRIELPAWIHLTGVKWGLAPPR